MYRRSKKLSEKLIPLGCAVGGILFVLSCRVAVEAAHYLHEPRTARALGQVRQFEQDLSPNQANTRLVYCQDTEEGVGIYFCDLTTGQSRLLCEQKEKGSLGRRFTMLGWSPDDSLLACALPDNQKNRQLILIFDGHTGDPLNQVVADPGFDEFAWLSRESFAYSVDGHSVRVVAKQTNGDWVHKRFFENVGINMDNFTALSSVAVAWRDDGGIGMFHFDSNTSERIWEAGNNHLMEFTCDPVDNQLLLNCSDDTGQYLLGLSLNDKQAINLGQISSHHGYIRKVFWGGNGINYACPTNDLAGSAFCLKTGAMAAPSIIPWHGGVRSCTLNGDHLFFSGNQDDQAPSLWDYDIKSGAFNFILSSTDSFLRNGLHLSSVSRAMTNSLGEPRFYHLWSPANFQPDKKYPVLLAQELNSWFPCFQEAALSGYYVAVADRPYFNTWDGEAEHSWVADVTRLAEIMAQNPNVDTNRVYLYACSRETCFLSQLMDERPALARGAILFSPVAFPDAHSLHDKHLLLVGGKTDADATKRLPEFQSRAVEAGNEVAVFLQDGAGHIVASGRTDCNRFREFDEFMSIHP